MQSPKNLVLVTVAAGMSFVFGVLQGTILELVMQMAKKPLQNAKFSSLTTDVRTPRSCLLLEQVVDTYGMSLA